MIEDFVVTTTKIVRNISSPIDYKGNSLAITKNTFLECLKQVVTDVFKVYLDRFWRKLPRETASFCATHLEHLCRQKKNYIDRFTIQWFAKTTI
ncbi:unnamed protein product [Cunninghamella blakesleeana]